MANKANIEGFSTPDSNYVYLCTTCITASWLTFTQGNQVIFKCFSEYSYARKMEFLLQKAALEPKSINHRAKESIIGIRAN